MIQWADEAQADLSGILRWLSDRNPAAADQVNEVVLAAIERLERFPYSGLEGRRAGTRELVIAGRPYIVIYAVHDTVVAIVRVLHGAQLWPPPE